MGIYVHHGNDNHDGQHDQQIVSKPCYHLLSLYGTQLVVLELFGIGNVLVMMVAAICVVMVVVPLPLFYRFFRHDIKFLMTNG